jgi:CRISPR system Cascade subunit CasE
MFLHRIHLDPRSREARRDLTDPYQLHSTLCRAFSEPDKKCPDGEFLWRLEPETDDSGKPRILVQSRSLPDWERINISGWLDQADSAIDLAEKLKLHSLEPGQRFRFRLRANPSVKRDGKRQAILQLEEQEKWLQRKSLQHGFVVPKLAAFNFSDSSQERLDVSVSHQTMLRGKQHSGNSIQIFSVLFNGALTISEPEKFKEVLKTGIGHGKILGLGLLSVAPMK